MAYSSLPELHSCLYLMRNIYQDYVLTQVRGMLDFLTDDLILISASCPDSIKAGAFQSALRKLKKVDLEARNFDVRIRDVKLHELLRLYLGMNGDVDSELGQLLRYGVAEERRMDV